MIVLSKEIDKGRFLIAEPFLPDTYFRRAVVLLCEHTEDGTIGFILNKPTNLLFNRVIPDCPPFDATVYFGGPVQQNTLHFVHSLGNRLEGSKEICDGIFWGGDFEKLKTLISDKKITSSEIRFFVGYAGWQKTQLSDELKEKSWILTSADTCFTFSDNSSRLWRDVLKSLGKDYAILANFPEDPSLN